VNPQGESREMPAERDRTGDAAVHYKGRAVTLLSEPRQCDRAPREEGQPDYWGRVLRCKNSTVVRGGRDVGGKKNSDHSRGEE